MGNYTSCSFGNYTKATRVIFPNGEAKQYRDQLVKAADLMLECPNYFLVNSLSLDIGHRFSPLGADDDLEPGNVYVFFPVRRLNSLITAADVAVLLVAANFAANRLAGGGARKARVMLENGSGESRQGTADETVPRLSLDGVDLGFQYRLTYCRSRKPVLETIDEEPTC